MLSSVLYLLFSSTSVEAHSWIQCTDYRGDLNYYQGNQCFGHVRPWQRGNNDIVSPNQVAFGVDQGFNKQMHETPDGQCNTLIDNQFAAGNFPMATYRRGQTVTLAWPAKNHVADFCDNNPGGDRIPDHFNGLYMENYRPGLNIQYNREVVFSPMTEGNTHVFGQIDYKGFQNCPKFCENRDKALCTGTFVVPDVPNGRYSFSWRWEFNGNRNPPERYVTCFEAEVNGDEVTPETGDKWDEGGIGMFVERDQGCNDHTTEEKCLSYADGRGGRVGQRCAWCCGENCNQQGGSGGDNKCEPVNFLNEQGIKRFRTAGTDNCTPPTAEPTEKPTPTPSVTPTEKPTAQPTKQPTMMPTEDPTTPAPTSMIAPNPAPANGANPTVPGATPGTPMTGWVPVLDANGVPMLDANGVPIMMPQSGMPGMAATQCAPLMGRCGGEGATTTCCQEGECVVLSPFVSQCQPKTSSSKSSSGFSMQTVLIAVFITFLVALCCGTIVVYKMCIASDKGTSGSYRRHDSLSDRDTRGGRYDDRNERRRKDKKKKSSRSRDRSRDADSRRHEKRTRRDSLSRSPKRTDSTGSAKSWVDDH